MRLKLLALGILLLPVARPAWPQAPLPGALMERVNRALEKARRPLLEQLANSAGGQRALLVLAAIHDGVPPEDKTFTKALRGLAEDNLSQTYDLSLRLLVMAELPSYPDRAAAASRDTKDLLRHQSADGGFSYGEGMRGYDLSNTQYGALGLRAAVTLGQKVPQSAWKRLLTLIENQQEPYGGFGYHGQGAPYASMTVAGIAVLEICKQSLEPAARVGGLDGRIARGWSWMDTHVADIGNPATRWSPYFHYGLERAAILSDKSTVAGKDWYELGAEMFVSEQLPDGSWGLHGLKGKNVSKNGTAVDTAFAILFLRRKFKKSLEGPITPSSTAPVSGLSAQSSDADFARAVGFDKMRGKLAVPELIGCLRSRVVLQRKGAALVLWSVSGQDFGYEPYLDPERQKEAIARVEEWWIGASRATVKR